VYKENPRCENRRRAAAAATVVATVVATVGARGITREGFKRGPGEGRKAATYVLRNGGGTCAKP